MQTPFYDYKIALASLKGTSFFSPAEIVRLEASSNYTQIYFTNKTTLLSCKVLKDFVQMLAPFGFIRTHRSHLINKQYILSVSQDGNILMQDLSIAEISRRKKIGVMKALNIQV